MTRRKSFRSSSPSSFYSFFFLFFFSSPFSLLLSLPYIYLFNSLHPVTATFFTVSFDSPSSSSSAPPNRGECSRIEDCLTEKDAVEVFKRNGENEDEETGEHRKEGHVSSGRVNEGGGGDQRKEQEEEERRKKEEVSQKDVQLAIERGWWDLAKQIILKSHTHNVDLASTVRKSVGEVRTHLDELIRVLNKQHHEIQVVPPAFQWAQSPVEVFLNIKFAYRWSSPGALSVTAPEFLSEERKFTFTGVGTHSGITKKYNLTLKLFDEINPHATLWSFASVGKVVVTLQKKKMELWDRLTEDKAKISNMNVWWDMKEKMQRDIDDFHTGNYTAKYTTSIPSSSSSSSSSLGENETEGYHPNHKKKDNSISSRSSSSFDEASSSSFPTDREEL